MDINYTVKPREIYITADFWKLSTKETIKFRGIVSYDPMVFKTGKERIDEILRQIVDNANQSGQIKEPVTAANVVIINSLQL